MRTAVAALVLTTFLAGCGDGSGPSPSPPPAEPTPPGDGAGGGGAGGGSGGGGTDGGGGTGGGGGEDRHASVERLDGDPECDALVPSAIPLPVRAQLETDAGHACGRGTSEGGGHVAVADVIGVVGGGFAEWQVLTPGGARADRMLLSGEVLLPQADGWQGALADATIQPMKVAVLTFAGDGSLRRTEPSTGRLVTRSWELFGDPLGGSLLVENGTLAAVGAPPCDGDARRFDAAGAPRGAAAPVGCILIAAGVSTAGDALVLENALDRSILRWLRTDGTAARPTSDEGAAFPIFGAGAIRLAPLLDGSLAAASGPDWIRRYPHLAARGGPAPAWLASRPGFTFRFTRGNAGYALLPAPGASSPDCTQAIDLVAPDGRLCGRVTLREDAADCTTGAVDQGWDGTVVQQSGKDSCTYRWWPRLLAAP